jgi:hypothetical protein
MPLSSASMPNAVQPNYFKHKAMQATTTAEDFKENRLFSSNALHFVLKI